MQDLKSKVALVTGGSRGIGKWTALAMARSRAAVYITGRTVTENTSSTRLPGSITTTAKKVEAFGGRCIPIQCEHMDDGQVEAVFERIERESSRLDVLVNAVWGGYEYFSDGTEFWTEKDFWDMPFSRWNKMFDSGVRANFVSNSLATKLMLKKNRGLLVNLSFWAADRSDKGAAYSAAKAATNKMTECMAFDLRDTGISLITLYPGLVRIESVMKAKDFFDLPNSESTEFTGLIVCELM